MSFDSSMPIPWLTGSQVGLGPYVRELVDEYWR
jgi:hypothetical protein